MKTEEDIQQALLYFKTMTPRFDYQRPRFAHIVETLEWVLAPEIGEFSPVSFPASQTEKQQERAQ